MHALIKGFFRVLRKYFLFVARARALKNDPRSRFKTFLQRYGNFIDEMAPK